MLVAALSNEPEARLGCSPRRSPAALRSPMITELNCGAGRSRLMQGTGGLAMFEPYAFTAVIPILQTNRGSSPMLLS